MHVVLLNDDVLPEARGGSAVVCDFQRMALSKMGYSVTLITTHQTKKPQRRYFDHYGEIISIPVSYPWRLRHFRALKMGRVSKILDVLLKELQPDIVHAHTIHAYLTYDALRIAKKYTNRVFMTAHDTFLVSFHRVKGARYFESAKSGKPYRMHWFEHLLSAGRVYNPFRNHTIKKILQRTGTKIISISGALDSFLKTNGIQNTVIVPNGVPIDALSTQEERERLRKELGLTGLSILYGGRINEDKGIKAFVEAIELVHAQFPTGQFVISGDEKNVWPFLREIPDSLRRSLILTGWLPQEKMPLLFSACDIITTPSLYLDAFNMMNIEAMVQGKPVVGTCFGGTAEIVLDNITGFVRDPRDTESYANALLLMLKEEGLRTRMGKAGRLRVEEEYSLKKHIAALTLLFDVK